MEGSALCCGLMGGIVVESGTGVEGELAVDGDIVGDGGI